MHKSAGCSLRKRQTCRGGTPSDSIREKLRAAASHAILVMTCIARSRTPLRGPEAGAAGMAIVVGVLIVAALIGIYFWIVLSWSYSSGERAGWVQKFSRKGWLCKTWEGEMAMVSMPGTTADKFYFTVHDDAVAEQINQIVGRRVMLHYEEKVGLPTSCFGETRYFVTRAAVVEDIPLAPGVVVPAPPPAAAPAK